MSTFITGIRIWPNEGDGPVVAGGSVTIADAVAVRYRLIRKKDGSGYFIALPQSQNRKFDDTQAEGDTNRRYFDEVWPTSKEVRVELQQAVEAAYNEATGGTTVATTTETTGAVTGGTAPIPF